MEERKKRSELKGKEERGRVAVHSQVRKIKQESDSEQIMDWAFGFGQPEVRPVRHQLSRWVHACMIHYKWERRTCFQVTLLRGSTFALKQARDFTFICICFAQAIHCGIPSIATQDENNGEMQQHKEVFGWTRRDYGSGKQQWKEALMMMIVMSWNARGLGRPLALSYIRSQGELKKWNKQEFGNIHVRKNELIQKLEEAQQNLHDEHSAGHERSLRLELEKILEAEQIYWLQKSRVNWIINGPDGNPTIFFQQNWDVVGTLVTDACLNYLNAGKILKEMTFIVLVPKRNNPEEVSHHRPISLYNVVYKVIAKILQWEIQKGMQAMDVECVLCHGGKENLEHLFRDCSFSRAVSAWIQIGYQN
ncbi:hypothetical protein J1N35_017180 [Gossypium stocksii]|uniref:Reverse transcriptase zinc-binding domain-containing protein n=1 Tax=Gossypium stocksii TaxID=47602 RepID=A0A9D3VNH3_9ROSI|nr:hypothetical protein J1N35_017180 [Gossypium stocksii]